MRPAIRTTGLFVVLGFVACDDGGGRTETTIGPAGGAHSAHGLTIEVARGALDREHIISIEKVDPRTLPRDRKAISQALRVEPEEISFAIPARMTLDFDVAQLPDEPGAGMMLRRKPDGKWQNRGGRRGAGNRIVGSTSGFSEWTIGFLGFGSCGMERTVDMQSRTCRLANTQLGVGVRCRILPNGRSLCSCQQKASWKGLATWFEGGCDEQSLSGVYYDDCGFECVDADEVCVPKTCAQLGASCGQQPDGCGGTLACGTCTGANTCGGGGIPNQCGGGCTVTTCAATGATCGLQPDGCGGLLECGVCGAGEVCQGLPAVCVDAPGNTCAPSTCIELDATCGLLADGCGGTLVCGTCSAGMTCSLGECVPSSPSSCVPSTCSSLNATCGLIPDGCGGVLACGTCASPQQCGGGGTPYTCG